MKQDLRFVYDGWHMIATESVSGSTYTVKNAYTWGLDVSGTRGGAGGIGGLVAWYDYGTNKKYAPCYDGRGNVSLVYGLNDSHVISEYEYDPYGRMLRTTGYTASGSTWSMVSYDPINNPFRYQTKWHLQGALGVDRDSGFTQFDIYDYGKRWYHPKQGRFINRDPIGEQGGRNLFGYCGNDPVNGVDVLGMMTEKEYAQSVQDLLDLYDQYGLLSDPSMEWSPSTRANLANTMLAGNFDWYDEINDSNTATRAAVQARVHEMQCKTNCVSVFDNAIQHLKNNYGSWNKKDNNDTPSTPTNPGNNEGQAENPTNPGGNNGQITYGTGVNDRVRPPTTFNDERSEPKGPKIWMFRNVRNVQMFVPVTYVGPDATPNNIALFESTIQDKWSGQMNGVYNVTITFIEGGYRNMVGYFTNYVYMIDAGDAMSWYSNMNNIDGTHSVYGVTYMNVNHITKSAAHEFGHWLMNSIHYDNKWAKLYPNNIMVISGPRGIVEFENIDQALIYWGPRSMGFEYQP